eukprot:8315227-Pyramimonas_sp.AAC.1
MGDVSEGIVPILRQYMGDVSQEETLEQIRQLRFVDVGAKKSALTLQILRITPQAPQYRGQ